MPALLYLCKVVVILCIHNYLYSFVSADTPSVKITYSAKVSSVFPVLLSAIRQSPPPTGPVHDGKVVGKDPVTYSYHQPVPIPSYLIAVASGNVHYRAFPKHEDKEWTCGIWAEPELIDSAYWEFSQDTARYILCIILLTFSRLTIVQGSLRRKKRL
ncbi:hypothetical protein C0993_001975 [Termitomyces sp. T159_Od127]|nr:hypothetical protein C0993_001975 [Termitomyces sp. T159_Od127]